MVQTCTQTCEAMTSVNWHWSCIQRNFQEEFQVCYVFSVIHINSSFVLEIILHATMSLIG